VNLPQKLQVVIPELDKEFGTHVVFGQAPERDRGESACISVLALVRSLFWISGMLGMWLVNVSDVEIQCHVRLRGVIWCDDEWLTLINNMLMFDGWQLSHEQLRLIDLFK